MRLRYAWLPVALTLISVAAHAATEVGTVTLIDGGGRLLRGATWYKLATGVRVEETDILDVPERALVQVEFSAGSIVSMSGPGVMYLAPAKSPPMLLAMPQGWAKISAKAPGLRIQTVHMEIIIPEGIAVMRAQAAATELFVEGGGGRVVEMTATGADGAVRDVKRSDYWAKATVGSLISLARMPKPFLDSMPRPFADPLPVLAATTKSRPTLVADHDITFAEAEPWLAGRDRAIFEKRFAVRLKDPAFRKAVEPTVARYPSWDRQLHPEKFAPKIPTVK